MQQVNIKKKRKPVRTWLKFAGKLHLWLGLSIGFIVLIISLAASVFVWDIELNRLFHADIIKVKPGNSVRPMSELLSSAQHALGNKPVNFVHIVNRADQAYLFVARKEAPRPGLTWFSENEYFLRVYVNPYTGKVTGILDMRYEPIYLFRVIHQQLLLRYSIGHLFVAISSFIYVLMIVTGLILWFPRNKGAWKQRFKIKWNTSAKRLNHDLHNVGGFYIQPLLIILIVTGLVWSFRWWQYGIYAVLGISQKDFITIPNPPAGESKMAYHTALDLAFIDAWKQHRKDPVVEMVSVFDKKNIAISVEYTDGNLTPKGEYRNYSVTTGKEYFVIKHHDFNIAQKFRNMNYGIHVGSLFGLPTKILAFIASLFSASLPVSGFLIWRGRAKKRNAGRLKG